MEAVKALDAGVVLEGEESIANLESKIAELIQAEADKEIISIETLADTEVAFGIDVGALGLPQTVEVTLANNSKITLAVTWDTNSYDGNTLGNYEFEGTLTHTEVIVNSSKIKAKMKVIATEPEFDANNEYVNMALNAKLLVAKRPQRPWEQSQASEVFFHHVWWSGNFLYSALSWYLSIKQ